MYRYFLFCCEDYYPSGGMEDCVLKTNDLNEMARYIDENYSDDIHISLHYYDIVEDKIMYALRDEFYEDNCFERQKFVCWSKDRE